MAQSVTYRGDVRRRCLLALAELTGRLADERATEILVCVSLIKVA